MPKTLLQELEATLTTEEKLALSILQNNPKVKERFEIGGELYGFYVEGSSGDDADAAAKEAERKAATERAAADKTEADRKAAADKKAADDRAAAAAIAGGNNGNGGTDRASLLSELGTLLDSRFDKLKSEFIPLKAEPGTPAAKVVDEFRTGILATALKLSDDYATIRETHREEFNERLDRNAFEEFVKTNTYPNLKAAHDAFVSEKRVEARVAKGIKDGRKQKESAESVPAQTTSTAPARIVLNKAREKSSSGDGTSSMEKAVAKLRELNRTKEDGGGA